MKELEKRLKHTEELLGNLISLVFEYWNNEDTDTIRHYFKDNLGFTDGDMSYWGIEDDLREIDYETCAYYDEEEGKTIITKKGKDNEEDEEDIILPWQKY